MELAAAAGQNSGISADPIAIRCIELVDIELLIWRRVAVPNATNLQTPRRIIQGAMGWQDYHLWKFAADVRGARPGGCPLGAQGLPRQYHQARQHHRGRQHRPRIYQQHGRQLEHRIVVERIAPAKAGKSYPEFLGGERHCPPEDRRGFPGSDEFLDIIAGPTRAKAASR